MKTLYKRTGFCGFLTALAVLLCFGATTQSASAQLKKNQGPVDAQLVRLYESTLSTAPQALKTSGLRPAPLGVRGDMVLVDAVADGDPDALAAKLRDIGMVDPATHGRYCSGWLPISSIGKLGTVDGLRFVRPSAATNNVGLVTSQGDAAMNTDDVRSVLGFDGTGVRVGVLSDSYDCLGDAATDMATGDLPSDVIVLKDEPGCGSGSDEGRAMMQLIRDVAPGASQAFHTAFGGFADFANGIVKLATDAGSNVIVDDVIYFAEAMFQDDIIAQAANQVAAMGVPYFSSAGNQARDSYESEFRNSGIPGVFGGLRHDFDPGPGTDGRQSITVGSGVTIFSFQWSEPFFSISGAPGSASDLDIVLYEAGSFIGIGGFNFNIGGDAVEVFGVFNPGPPAPLQIGIELFAGPAPEFIKYVIFGPTDILEFDTKSGTAYGHSNARHAESVGAARYTWTPAFGVDPPVIEPFSSAGGTPILFETDGTPTFELRHKPEIVAPDGTNTTFFFFDFEPDGFPNFFGTSAAAPHAAGVAAVMLGASPGMSPADIYSTLESTAIDMDDPVTPGFDTGFDFGTGYGLIDAFPSVVEASGACIIAPFDEPGSRMAENIIGDDGKLFGTVLQEVHGARKVLHCNPPGYPLGMGHVRFPAQPTCEMNARLTVAFWANSQASYAGDPMTGAEMQGVWGLLKKTKGPSSKWVARVRERGTGKLIQVETDGPIKGGEWHHFAMTFDGTKLKIFVDGVQRGLKEVAPTLLPDVARGTDVCRRDNSRYFHGKVDAFYVFNQRHSVHDIRKLMDSTAPVTRAEAGAETFSVVAGLASTAEAPDTFTLSDAYPNPFNPATTIEFGLPESEYVRLDVYNVVGRRVATLTDHVMPAGVHRVRFDGNDLANGLYLYRIQAGAFSSVKKMLLLK